MRDLINLKIKYYCPRCNEDIQGFTSKVSKTENKEFVKKLADKLREKMPSKEAIEEAKVMAAAGIEEWKKISQKSLNDLKSKIQSISVFY